MAASDAMTDAVTTSECLPSYYTYPETHVCLEHVSLMRQEWSDEGWFVQSVGVLKMSGDYKVCVTYAKLVPDTNTSNNFTETLWREANYNWKPTGVTITPREENQLTMWWSRRSDGAQLREGVKRLRLNGLPIDSSEDSSASGPPLPRSSTMATEVPVPTTTPSASSSAGESESSPILKRFRMTNDSEDV